jgi:hypothetical protein
VEALIGEVRTDVAGDAVGLAAKELQARLLVGRERVKIAIDEAVEGRISGEDRADETGEGAGDFRGGESGAGGGFG